MHSKRKIPNSWRTGWKAKACTSFVLCLKVFKNHLYYLWDVRVLSIKPCLHAQLPEHNKSYRKVSLGWGHLITWKGPMMGHLNSFSASGGGNLNNNFPKMQTPGGCLGEGDVEASIWLVHYLQRITNKQRNTSFEFFTSNSLDFWSSKTVTSISLLYYL